MPAAPVPPLNAAWRPNETGPAPKTREDRELIRQAAGYPASEAALYDLTVAMNRLATVSPAAVRQVQAWLNEAVELEAIWAGDVADGVAHLGNAESYEGPIPGRTITDDERQTKLGPIEWNASLLKVKTTAGSSQAATRGGVMASRIAALKAEVVQALGLRRTGLGSSGRLLRS